MGSPRVRFVAWGLVGAGACLAVLGALTIGAFVAPFVVVAAWALLRTAGVDRAVAGALTGVSAALFYVACLNREGPGEVCHVGRQVTECSEQWNPLPWLVIGLVFFVAGFVVYAWVGRVVRPTPSSLVPRA